MNLNLNGLTGNLTRNADKVGALAALLSKDTTGLSNIDSIISSIQQLSAGVLHGPDFSAELQRFLNNEGKNAIYAYIASMGLDAFNPFGLGKYSKAIEKGAVGYGAVWLAVRMLFGATHSEIKGTNIIGDSVQENFNNAPLAQRYYP